MLSWSVSFQEDTPNRLTTSHRGRTPVGRQVGKHPFFVTVTSGGSFQGSAEDPGRAAILGQEVFG